MSEKSTAKKPRPYWHVDMKWVSGLLLFVSLGSALLLYNLSALTERERATTISATIIAGLFSREGLDSEEGLNELRAKAALLPGDTIAPIPQFPWMQVSKQDIKTKSPRELRITLFKQLTEPIYDKGIAGAAKQFTSNPADQKKFAGDAALLGGFTKQAHDALNTAFLYAAIVSVILMAAFVYFSAGWGRLANPGALLLSVAPLGTVIGLLLTNPPSDGDSPFAAVPVNIAREVGSSFNGSYLAVAVTGIVLLVLAAIGKIVQTILRRHHRTHQTLDK